jgi:hypothetical protein
MQMPLVSKFLCCLEVEARRELAGTPSRAIPFWCGARLGGSKINAINLILRLFLYHFLHTMSS